MPNHKLILSQSLVKEGGLDIPDYYATFFLKTEVGFSTWSKDVEQRLHNSVFCSVKVNMALVLIFVTRWSHY